MIPTKINFNQTRTNQQRQNHHNIKIMWGKTKKYHSNHSCDPIRQNETFFYFSIMRKVCHVPNYNYTFNDISINYNWNKFFLRIVFFNLTVILHNIHSAIKKTKEKKKNAYYHTYFYDKIFHGHFLLTTSASHPRRDR